MPTTKVKKKTLPSQRQTLNTLGFGNMLKW